jgi:hypothetical protein
MIKSRNQLLANALRDRLCCSLEALSHFGGFEGLAAWRLGLQREPEPWSNG